LTLTPFDPSLGKGNKYPCKGLISSSSVSNNFILADFGPKKWASARNIVIYTRLLKSYQLLRQTLTRLTPRVERDFTAGVIRFQRWTYFCPTQFLEPFENGTYCFNIGIRASVSASQRSGMKEFGEVNTEASRWTQYVDMETGVYEMSVSMVPRYNATFGLY